LSYKDKFVNVEISLNEIMRGMSDDVDGEDWFEFVKEMDVSYFDDWEITNKLYEYFKTRHEDFLKEEELTEEEYQDEYQENDGVFYNNDPKQKIIIDTDGFDTMDEDSFFTA